MASRILGIGKEILKTSSRVSADGLVPPADAKRAQDAVKWIQRAFSLIEKMEDTDTAGVVDLKVCAVRVRPVNHLIMYGALSLLS